MRKRCLDMVNTLAQRDERVVFIGSDLSPGLLGEMKKAYPERYYMEGVAEANIIGMAAGMLQHQFVSHGGQDDPRDDRQVQVRVEPVHDVHAGVVDVVEDVRQRERRRQQEDRVDREHRGGQQFDRVPAPAEQSGKPLARARTAEMSLRGLLGG